MEVLFFIPFIILILIAMTMIFQGWMVMYEEYGYSQNPSIKKHPEMIGVKGGDELMTVRFDEMPCKDYDELYERINKLKMEELFEEPSSYEDDIDNDYTI